jgi:hypothetical protein
MRKFEFPGGVPDSIEVDRHRRIIMSFQDGIDQLLERAFIEHVHYDEDELPKGFVEYSITRFGYSAADSLAGF